MRTLRGDPIFTDAVDVKAEAIGHEPCGFTAKATYGDILWHLIAVEANGQLQECLPYLAADDPRLFGGPDIGFSDK